jgi:Zn finger protein HypA/HybF involved in hydrogenase expression
MKRRLPAKAEPVLTPEVIAPQIVASARESARQTLNLERAPRAAKCVVCGDQASVDAAEQLCWVCRRLKISAWRDADHQLPAQE